MSHTAHEIRVGLTGETNLNEKTAFRAILEGVHRIDDEGAGFSGQVIGLFPFAIEGDEIEKTWMRGGFEISRQLRENMILAGTIFDAAQGEDPTVSGAVNINFLF